MEKFGPAMSRLTGQEQLFVLCFFENGGNQSKALETAGFQFKNTNSRNRMAHYYIHKQEIKDAIKEEHERRNVMLVPKVQRAIENLIDHPEHQDHFKALKMASDNAGVSKSVERVLKVDVTVSDKDKIERIKLFAINHGIDPKKLLGYDPDGNPEQTAEPIDAEVVELEEWQTEDIDDLL